MACLFKFNLIFNQYGFINNYANLLFLILNCQSNASYAYYIHFECLNYDVDLAYDNLALLFSMSHPLFAFDSQHYFR